MGLREIADELYAGAPADFTAARTAAEKQARAAGDKELAAAVKALRKPSVAAWAVNQLVRLEAERIDQVLGLAEDLRAAAEALDGAQLRELTRQRRQLTATLATRARQLALEHGSRLTGTVADQVESTLTAAMLDASAADAVRTGLLVGPVSANGVDVVELEEVLALHEAIGSRAEPVSAQPLRAVPESIRLKREKAQEALASADAAVASATRDAERTERRVHDLEATGLQRQGELEELRRRVAQAEESFEALDAELESAGTEHEQAVQAVGAAEAERDRAQRELDALGG